MAKTPKSKRVIETLKHNDVTRKHIPAAEGIACEDVAVKVINQLGG